MAIALGVSGCAADANGSTTAPSPQESTEETTQADTTVVETVSGTIESMAESDPEDRLQFLRIYGPVTILEGGLYSIDNQSDVSMSGEIIINTLAETTYILDGVSGMPVKGEDIKDGDILYSYISPAMTRSLPPMTFAAIIFTNVEEEAKAPEYVEVKSMVTDADTSRAVLTAVDNTQYTLTDDCNIFPYLTRDIVTLDDLTAGKECVVWTDEDGNANKIMLFAQ